MDDRIDENKVLLKDSLLTKIVRKFDNNEVDGLNDDRNGSNIDGDRLKGRSEVLLKEKLNTSDIIIDDNHSSKTGVFHQILLTCSVLLLAAACGMPIGYSAVLLPQLYNTTDPLNLDIEMGSWIASVHSLATPVGSFASGPIMDRWGRRPALMLAIIPLLMGWSFLALASSHYLLLVGRVFAGISVGLIAAPAQVLIAEIAEPHLRGILIGAPFVAYSMGILFVYALGSTLHWREVAWCGTILPIMSLVALFFAPESPIWLARHGFLEKASTALSWLRGGDLSAKKELHQLIIRIENENAQMTVSSEKFVNIVTRKSLMKPLILINVFHVLQILSGTYLVVFYAVDIISEFGSELVSTMMAAVLTAVVRLLFTVIYCFLLLFMTRRKMVISSGIGSAVSTITLAVFSYCRLGQTKTSLDIYVAGICMLIYIGSNTGFMVMPGIMVGELLPAKIRGQIAGYLFSLFNIILFCVAKGFPWAQQMLKTQGLFLVFGFASLIATVFLYFMLPETKGESLGAIEDYFNQNNWLWVTRKNVRKNEKGEI